MTDKSTPPKKGISFRYVYMGFGALLAMLFLFATAPGANVLELTFGASVVVKLVGLFCSVLGVAMLHLSRKGLLDYIDLSELVEKAKESSVGAGLVFIGVAITMLAVALVIGFSMANF